MDQCDEIGIFISLLLDSEKYKEVLNIPNDDKYSSSFKNNCGDVIRVIVSKVQDDTIVLKPSLRGACEELLSVLVQKANPEELLLELIEQIEIAKNDAQFSLVILPLQQLLEKLSVKRGRSFEWCLNSIRTYINNIPIPKFNLEGKERLLMDSDNNIRRITRVYSLLPPFYRPFIKELTGSCTNVTTKQVLVAFLISLLGEPLIYIDLDHDENVHSEARQCCDNIIQDLCILEPNLLKFLMYVEVCNNAKPKDLDPDSEIAPYENREQIHLTALSGLFYAIFSGHFKVLDSKFPKIYSLEYIFNSLLHCVVHLLCFVEYGPLAKAIALGTSAINRFSSDILLLPSSFPHFALCKALMNVAIYCNYENIRKNAIKLMSSHIGSFDYKGRCTLVTYIIETANHSGMIGYAITLYKNAIDQAFKECLLPECFTGAQLMTIINKICHLPYGEETDLVEFGDQIITSLNFLRYLALKDVNNQSGIRDCFHFIENNYLKTLRTGLVMSKAHYELKLKDIKEGKNILEQAVNISINVPGNVLDELPTENKIEIMNSALNAFHLMEGLIARLSECININCKT